MAVVAPIAPPPVEERPTAGFVISLIAGILILINGLSVSTLGAFGITLFGIMPFGITLALGTIVMALAPVFGILVIVGALLMHRGSTEAGGVLVIVFGLLSIVIGGGFIIGIVLAIVGGALALAGK